MMAVVYVLTGIVVMVAFMGFMGAVIAGAAWLVAYFPVKLKKVVTFIGTSVALWFLLAVLVVAAYGVGEEIWR